VHIPYFVVGVAISRLLLRSDPLPAALALLVAAIGMSLVCFGHLPDIGAVQNPGNPSRLFAPLIFRDRHTDPLNLFNFGWLFALFLVGTLVNVGNGRLRRIDNFLGDITYPLYISHFTAIVVVGRVFGFLPDMACAWLAFAAALTLAVVLWFTIDRNVIRWRDRVRGVKLYARSSPQRESMFGRELEPSISAASG
ncbi:MAG: hypothetical protein JO128_10875, partial [Alphaproteobacteria bacterium]|nr:hypothetical protein [Alphaproteobacteria bacterium]